MSRHDVVVVGSGPNGLAAALTLARAGLDVLVLEAEATPGGGARTRELGIAPEGFPRLHHDICSAVHPLAWSSRFFREFDLAARGVDLLIPEISYAHPLDGDRAAFAYRDLDRTVAGLGVDGEAWRRLVGGAGLDHATFVDVLLGDRRLGAWKDNPVRHPREIATIIRTTLSQGTVAWNRRFREESAPALFSGAAAHAMAPQPTLVAAGTGLLLAILAHGRHGWPIPRGGSGGITAALVADLVAHGGTVRLEHRVRSASDLPPARAYVFDTTPRALARVLAEQLPQRSRRAFTRFPHGPAAAKVDLVIDGPVPWAVPEVAEAGTVHLQGTRGEAAAAQHAVWGGQHAERPIVLVSDPTAVDPARASGTIRPLWAYAQVPHGSTVDPTEAVVRQIERFAPEFRDVLVAARGTCAAALPDDDENYVGGDIAGGAMALRRGFVGPSMAVLPYGTGASGVYLCSSSTPPGPGVHGLSGWYAARRVLHRTFGIREVPSVAPDAAVRAVG